MAVTEREAEAQISQESPEAADFVYEPSVRPERMAWLVLISAFVLFCLLTATTALAVYTYLFRSTVAIPTELQVAQGTVGITGLERVEAVEREREDLTNTPASISTDALSQATLQFHELPDESLLAPSLVAAVTLQKNTSVSFDRATRPRFDWSLPEQHIRLSQLKGELDILVTGAANKPFRLAVSTAGGVMAEVRGNGRYRLSAGEDDVRLFNLAGLASLYYADEASARQIITGGNVLVARLSNRSIESEPAAISAMPNSSFSLQAGARLRGPEPALSRSWDCASESESFPPGRHSLEEFNGRFGLRLRRLDNATSYGAVNCSYSFGGEGLDVREYDSIKVAATFFLNYQSLSQCGTLSSECPLMLRLDYEDSLRVDRYWIRGFYYDKEVESEFDTRCSTCLQDHVVANKRVWYTFESENLLTLINNVHHPARLESFQFYASGHQFDTVVGEIILLLDKSADAYNGGQADD